MARVSKKRRKKASPSQPIKERGHFSIIRQIHCKIKDGYNLKPENTENREIIKTLANRIVDSIDSRRGQISLSADSQEHYNDRLNKCITAAIKSHHHDAQKLIKQRNKPIKKPNERPSVKQPALSPQDMHLLLKSRALHKDSPKDGNPIPELERAHQHITK